MFRLHTNVNMFRVTGISNLDDRTQCLYNSRFKKSTHITRACGCRCFVLCGGVLIAHLFHILEQWDVCYGRPGNPAVSTCFKNWWASINHIGHPGHPDCLLYGVYPHRDQSKQSSSRPNRKTRKKFALSHAVFARYQVTHAEQWYFFRW